MLKLLVLAGVIALSGCATRTAPVKADTPLPYYLMDNFKADCLYGDYQRKFLEDKIEEYQYYHRDHPYTQQDREYYSKLKNALWGLRSSCVSSR